MTLASTVLLASIPILVSLWVEQSTREDLKKFLDESAATSNLPVKKIFDFIVVGGGTAGCVLASRLSENPENRVLLLEAGDDPMPIQSVPWVAHFSDSLPGINFQFQTTQQKNAGLDIDGVMPIAMAKMLGGSSGHNGMRYERGSPHDFDRWAEETEDSSWAYANVRQYFLKTERYVGNDESRLRSGNHGTGPLETKEDQFSPGREEWLQAGSELGFKIVDSNSPTPVGFSASVLAVTREGRRESSYTAFIKKENFERTRKNLTIWRYSFVQKVIIENGKAVGVVFTRHGVPGVASATKEVILSAGAFMSPLILIQSGIGPLSQLQAAQVTPISILPGVGQNLMDHPYTGLGPFFVNKPELAWDPDTNLTFQDVDDFLQRGSGVLTTFISGLGVSAFLPSRRSLLRPNGADWADIQLYYCYNGGLPSAVSILVAMNDPHSRGSVTLNTSVPFTAEFAETLPIIDPNYYDDPTDLDVMVEGMELGVSVFEKAPVYQGLGAKYDTTVYPNCAQWAFRSTEYWKCYARFTSRPSWHAAGTCKMGRGASDPSAVVDSKLRVIGVTGLRVVDASIMPHVTSANTMAPVLMIAEKAAADILKAHERQLY